jgi:hypothetical protein
MARACAALLCRADVGSAGSTAAPLTPTRRCSAQVSALFSFPPFFKLATNQVRRAAPPAARRAAARPSARAIRKSKL